MILHLHRFSSENPFWLNITVGISEKQICYHPLSWKKVSHDVWRHWVIHLKELVSSVWDAFISICCFHSAASLFFLSFPFFSPPLLSSTLHPSWCTSHQTLKETKAPSLCWSWEELSVPSALFDDSISNDTLILTPHCLFFLYDEIQLERRATGHIIKMWLKHRGPCSSLETTCDNFCHIVKNMTR